MISSKLPHRCVLEVSLVSRFALLDIPDFGVVRVPARTGVFDGVCYAAGSHGAKWEMNYLR